VSSSLAYCVRFPVRRSIRNHRKSDQLPQPRN